MQIRFRASYFGQVAKKQISFVQIETGFSLSEIGRGDGTRAICLFARGIIQQFSYVRFLDIEN